MDELYGERIMDHYKNPRNYGRPKNYDCKAREANLPCGDIIEIFVKLENNRLKQINFVGVGCALSKGAASILTEALKGKSIKFVKKLKGSQFIKKYLKIQVTYGRYGCATLALKALKKALENKN